MARSRGFLVPSDRPTIQMEKRLRITNRWLKEKVRQLGWSVDADTITAFAEEAVKRLEHHPPDVFLLQMKALIHYLTLAELLSCCVPTKPEHAYLVGEYRKLSASTSSFPLQDPEVTFGERLRAVICPKCRVGECAQEFRQTRSADEPTAVLFECKNSLCKHRFRQ